AAAAAPSVDERLPHVVDARPLVDDGQPKAAPPPVVEQLDEGPSLSRVHHDVPGQLAGRRNDLGLVDDGEPRRDGRGADLSADHDHVAVPPDGQRPERGHFRASRAWFNIAIPRSRLSAVRAPPKDNPSSARVIATAGCMPTTTVGASSSRVMSAIAASIRPMKESMISTAVMSMITPRAPCRTTASDRSSRR